MSKKNYDTSTVNTNRIHGLVWNKDLTLEDINQSAIHRKKAIEHARSSRPRTAKIEKEIMIAVVVLYVLILGSFASLHLYASAMSETKDVPVNMIE